MSNNLSDRQIRLQKLGDAGRTTLWRYRQDPKFPRPRKLGGRNLTPEHLVDAYLEEVLGEPPARPKEQPRDRRGRFGDRDKAPGPRRERGRSP
jgi:predicted DNA-binding transcriptional regulator AlpA